MGSRHTGVKRMETRLITEYVKQRIENLELKAEKMTHQAFVAEGDEIKMERYHAAREELEELYDILGGYNEA